MFKDGEDIGAFDTIRYFDAAHKVQHQVLVTIAGAVKPPALLVQSLSWTLGPDAGQTPSPNSDGSFVVQLVLGQIFSNPSGTISVLDGAGHPQTVIVFDSDTSQLIGTKVPTGTSQFQLVLASSVNGARLTVPFSVTSSYSSTTPPVDGGRDLACTTDAQCKADERCDSTKLCVKKDTDGGQDPSCSTDADCAANHRCDSTKVCVKRNAATIPYLSSISVMVMMLLCF